MNEPITFLDFFSGVGGFRKGFELCGMVCKGHCEIDKFADRSYSNSSFTLPTTSTAVFDRPHMPSSGIPASANRLILSASASFI